jgi:hypothetical protein
MLGDSKDRIKKLLLEIRQKYTLNDLRLLLKAEELGTAPGWDQLAEKFEAGDAVLKSKAEKVLVLLHGDLILGGTKDVEIFDLHKSDAELIASELSKIKPAAPNFGKDYPFSISETALEAFHLSMS